MASPQLKTEPVDDVDSPEGLLAPRVLEVPEDFTRDEWANLTEGYDCEADEIRGVIALRGQGGSQKGRPTNFAAPFKGELSLSKRAVAQRERASFRGEEGKALAAAKDADRQAKQTLRKKIAKDHPTLSKGEAKDMFDNKWELVNDQRFHDKKSVEWLECALLRVHKKWDDIRRDIDIRAHDRIVKKIAASLGKKKINDMTCASGLSFVFDKGGVVEKLIRQEYKQGLQKLKDGTFASDEQKEIWQQWVETLDEKDLAMIANNDWQYKQIGPVAELPAESDNLVLDATQPYIKYEDDQAEEEVDWDSDIDEMYEEGPDEYETEEAYRAAIAEAEAASDSEEEEEDDSDKEESDSEDEEQSDSEDEEQSESEDKELSDVKMTDEDQV